MRVRVALILSVSVCSTACSKPPRASDDGVATSASPVDVTATGSSRGSVDAGRGVALPGPPGPVTGQSVEIAPAGPLAVSLERTGEVADAYAHPIAWAPDGRSWASGEQQHIGLWQGLERKRRLDVWVGDREALRFSADGKRLMAGHRLIDVASGEVLVDAAAGQPSFDGPGWSVDAAAWSPDETQVLLWVRWHPSRCCRGREEKRPADPSRVLAVDVDTRRRTASPGTTLQLERDWQEWSALAIDAHRLIVGGTTDQIHVFDRKTLAPTGTIRTGIAVTQLQLSRDGRWLGGVRGGTEIVLMDPAERTVAASWKMPGGESAVIDAWAFHPSLPLLVTSDESKRLRIWSFESLGESRGEKPGEKPGEKSGTKPGTKPGRELASVELPEAPRALAWSPAGDELLVAMQAHPTSWIYRYALRAVTAAAAPPR